MNNLPTQHLPPNLVQESVLRAARRSIRTGVTLFFLVFVVLLTVASMAPLYSAAIGVGTVVLDANRKVVEHLEGGIIDAIFVRDGDRVEKGEVLIRLSETAARAQREIVQGQYVATRAMEDRLVAERDGLDNITFHDDLTDANVDALEAQRRIFTSRRENMAGQRNVLKQRIAQLNEEIEGLGAQRESVDRQRELIEEEVSVVEQLVAQGQAVRPRLLALQRNAAELQGRGGELKASIAKARQAIAENELLILNLKTEQQAEIAEQLREVQVQVGDLRERLTAARDVLTRIEITAPQAGIITGLNFHTEGGVIPPGGEVLQIVPQDDALVIEARINPQDIDSVRKGQPARVRLTAFNARHIPLLQGFVIVISADLFTDDATGEGYYKARIRIQKQELEKLQALGPGVELYPGMPAEVYIVTGERTIMSYLIDPLTRTFDRAMREE